MQTPLRKLRLEQHLTIQDVAKATEIDVGNLSRIERGKQVTSLTIAEKLSKFSVVPSVRCRFFTHSVFSFRMKLQILKKTNSRPISCCFS